MDGLISKVGGVADGMKRMSKLVITAVCGAAAGAGVSLALAGDFMICADHAKFILAFVHLGLAYKVTTVDELDEVTMAFAKKLAAGPLISYKNIKKQLYDASYADYKQWLDETEVPTQRECAASMDFQEGCKAFMEKRKAVFQGK